VAGPRSKRSDAQCLVMSDDVLALCCIFSWVHSFRAVVSFYRHVIVVGIYLYYALIVKNRQSLLYRF
jgi:hypothetical protein